MSSAQIMGIVNLTPDSFSDGGDYLHAKCLTVKHEALWKRVKPWIEAGISWLDLGAESTRPGSTPISQEEEWVRLKSALDFLHSDQCHLGQTRISIDSKNPQTHIAAIQYPYVGMLNCVCGTRHTEHLSQLIKERSDIYYLSMHMHKDPQIMQLDPLNADIVLQTIEKFFYATTQDLVRSGFSKERIILDPGIGFGKTIHGNLHLLTQAYSLCQRWRNMAYGISRKSFIGSLSQIESPKERDSASKPLEAMLIAAGVSYIRTHDPIALLSAMSFVSEKLIN